MKLDSKKLKWHEMTLIVMNGKVHHVGLPYARDLIIRREFFIAVVAFSFFCALISPVILSENFPLYLRFPFWLKNFLLGVFLWVFCAVLFSNLFRILHLPWPVPTPIVLLSSVSVSLWVNGQIISRVFGNSGLLDGSSFSFMLRYMIVGMVFEFFVVQYLVPEFERRTGRSHRPEDKAADPKIGGSPEITIKINQNSYVKSQICYLKSAEHYVEIVTAEGASLERARLSDLISLLEDHDGIQPHRSYWVSRHSAIKLERVDGNCMLFLRDGEKIPVSRAREKDVRNWLET